LIEFQIDCEAIRYLARSCEAGLGGAPYVESAVAEYAKAILGLAW